MTTIPQPPMLSNADQEFLAGYFDGRDPDAPEPSANRSACYRHSFTIGRRERTGQHLPAHVARELAAEAERKDAAQ